MPRIRTAGIQRPWPDLPMIYEMGRTQRPTARPGGLSPHRNQGIEICYIRKGRFRWQVEGETYTLGAGDGYVTLPWQVHGGEHGLMHAGALEYVVIGLPACAPHTTWRWGTWSGLDKDTQVLVQQALLARPSARLAQAEAIGALFDEIWAELVANRPGRAALVRSLLTQMLVTVARLKGTEGSDVQVDARVARALEVVAQQIDYPWQLADMARLAGLGRTRFAELVHGLTGLSPMKTLERQRLERAQALLADTDHPITQIAFDVGYTSSQYFAHAFRKAWGMSPREFRQGAWR